MCFETVAPCKVQRTSGRYQLGKAESINPRRCHCCLSAIAMSNSDAFSCEHACDGVTTLVIDYVLFIASVIVHSHWNNMAIMFW